MGLTQSIHDINIINANNGTDEQIPISNIQSMSNSLNNMQQRYNLIPSQNLKNMNYSTRNTNTYSVTLYTKLGYKVVKEDIMKDVVMQACEKILKK